jgi:parallel beta-helix repeat protein
MFRLKSLFIGAAGIIVALVMSLVALPLAVSAAPAGSTGFTAAIVATSGQKITGAINASGFDIGIYIGPGVRNVKVTAATITGANDEGILVQDAANIVIKDSTISGNGVDPDLAANGGPLTENKGIVLAGSTNCLVQNNIVENNLADGGIALLDDGPNHPFAPDTVTTAPIAGTGNVITGNLVRDNLGGCGIVVSAKNPGGGVSHNLVSKNTVLGFNPAAGDFIPGVGGIIVAGGVEGAVQIMDNVILNNVVTGGFLPGISLHAHGPAIISGTKLISNVLSNNGGGEAGEGTTGIEIYPAASDAVITGTQVLSDTVSNDDFGVWHSGDAGTHIANLQTDNVATPVFP